MAVSRRQKENDTFTDIAQALPLSENAKELDKASVLRVAIHYLKLRDMLADCSPPSPVEETSATSESKDDDDTVCCNNPSSNTSTVTNFSNDVTRALDGFMMMVSRDGRILYTTESISQYLGLRQVDVIGVHIKDIVHPQDYQDISSIFQAQGRDATSALGNDPLRRNVVMRMRCAFTPSVRSITRCSNFKPIFSTVYLKFSNKKVKEGEFLGMVMLCKLASVLKVRELCVGAFFKTKHSLDLSYTTVDTRIRWILGFDPSDMVGLKAYNYFHPLDLTATSSCHTNLLVKGHSHSPCYRFMNRDGDWVWVRSKSQVTYDPVSHLPNGLSLYTWIVRYEEEDDRMKAIMSGDDPGQLGVKEVDQSAVAGCDIDISALADPSTTPPLSTPLPQQDLQRSDHLVPQFPVVSPEQNPSPQSNQSQFLPSTSPQQTHNSPPPHSSYLQSPPYTPYSEQSPPFLGYTSLNQPQATLLNSPTDSNHSPVKPNKHSHHSLITCNQTSFDSQNDLSPPYSTDHFHFLSPSTSPTNSLVHGSTLSPSNSLVHGSVQSPVDYSYSPPTHHSPAEATVAHYSMGPEPTLLPNMAADVNTMFMPAAEFPDPTYTNSSILSMATDMSQQYFPIKQEFHIYPPNNQVVGDSVEPTLKAQARLRYTHVTVAGSHNEGRRRNKLDDLDVNGISQWLQESAPSVY